MLNSALKFTEEQPILFAGVAATLLLGTAFVFQFFGYPPCDLCWWQRYPYVGIMAVSLLGTAIKALPQKLVLLLLAALFLTDAGIAGFHAGVEQRWWEGLQSCSGYVNYTDSVNDLLASLQSAPLIRCDEIAWSLFGLSMAVYNMIAALGMTVFCIKKAQKA